MELIHIMEEVEVEELLISMEAQGVKVVEELVEQMQLVVGQEMLAQ